jgi:hypothetical protein
MTERILPLGSVVLLKDGVQKLLVVGRGAVYSNQETGEDEFNDYMAVLYPAGMNPESTIFFNQDDIDKVIFSGFVDDDETRFLEIYAEWKEQLEREAERKYLDAHTFGF